jgi:NAD(P)-dependent dehydrogenase (short-subunit alcohol dehydrogenase family)
VDGLLLRRQAIVTGASQGLGLEIGRRFVTAGADVLLCARDHEALRLACEELSGLARPGQQVIAEAADVSVPADASRVVERCLDELRGCHVLVNNAGIYGPKGCTEEVSWSDWVRTIEINLHGSVLMCRAVLPHFKRHGYGKIIQLSGGGATNPMPMLSAYAASKAAVVRFAESLAEELRGSGIDVNAIAPGALNTRMLNEVLAAGPERVGEAFYERARKQQQQGGVPLERGAELAVFLASASSDGITAKLISAVWDNWGEWSAHLEELAGSDAYTLRRITGRDRKMPWGDR